MMYNFLMQEGIFDVIIIGSGPAGLTAAIYTSRDHLKTLVIGGNPPGGQLTTTSDVENFPGFPQGISGPELINKMREQAVKFSCEVIDKNVLTVTGSSKSGFELKTDLGSVFKGKSVIVATGASARWLGLESEQRLRGKGVSACATCDGFFFKNKVVGVIGDGDCAMEEANHLTKFASKVYVFVWFEKEKMKASKIMQKRTLENPKIEFLFNTEVKEVLGETTVKGLRILNNKSGEEKTLSEVEGLFLAIGRQPNTKFLEGFIELEKGGYVKCFGETKTSKDGVFVAGDVSDCRYQQAIIAAGAGGMAGLDAARFLTEKK